MKFNTEYHFNKKTIFLRYVENMLLKERMLTSLEVKRFRKHFASELLWILQCYEKDFYCGGHDEMTAAFSIWTIQ
jgi:hypothetical protein